MEPEGMMEFLATCARGTGSVVAQELTALGATEPVRRKGGVVFRGGWAEAYRACLHLRSAHRVIRLLGSFPGPDADALYQGVSALDWSEHLTPGHTLAVECHGVNAGLTNSRYTAQRIKDAVVDQFRDRCGERPSVDLKSPDVRIVAHLKGTSCQLGLDLAGESLHRRGYRLASGRAPLRETLAASILLLGDYRGTQPLVDPMCGAGTFAIEAVMMALGRPPNLARTFGFEGWPGHDESRQRLIREIREEARSRTEPPELPPVLASDVDPEAIRLARVNADRAGLARHIRFHHKDVRRLRIEDRTSLLVANPPYGKRLQGRSGGGIELIRALGDRIRALRGGRGMLLLPEKGWEKAVGLKATWKREIRNGPIPVWLERYDR